MGIVKTTTPFVNATTLVIWDFTRNVGVSKIKVISWQAGQGLLYEPFMAGEGLYYTRAGFKGADIGGAQLMPLASCLISGSPTLGSCWARWLSGLGGWLARLIIYTLTLIISHLLIKHLDS